jgi:hypothetical protein
MFELQFDRHTMFVSTLLNVCFSQNLIMSTVSPCTIGKLLQNVQVTGACHSRNEYEHTRIPQHMIIQRITNTQTPSPQTYPRTFASIRVSTQARMHAHTHARISTRTHTRARMRPHTHTPHPIYMGSVRTVIF